ncbi:MAG: ABC transporter permease, partial [Dehalococcoidia bacterium]
AGLTVFSLVALPPAAAALAVAAWRYDLALSVSPMAVPGAVLVVAVASAVGYAVGHVVPNPRMTNLITQVMIFVVTIFSPINFPSERFPEWLQAVHRVLPMEHAAIVMRSTLSEGLVTGATWPSWLALAVWAVGCWIVTYLVMSRRG